MNRLKDVVCDDDSFYSVKKLFKWSKTEILTALDERRLLTEELDKKGIKRCIVGCGLEIEGIQSHAFTMKKDEERGWAVFDHAFDCIKYSCQGKTPAKSYWDCRRFLSMTDSLVVYTLKREPYKEATYNRQYAWIRRVMTGETENFQKDITALSRRTKKARGKHYCKKRLPKMPIDLSSSQDSEDESEETEKSEETTPMTTPASMVTRQRRR